MKIAMRKVIDGEVGEGGAVLELVPLDFLAESWPIIFFQRIVR
jgi:hypothetical protein